MCESAPAGPHWYEIEYWDFDRQEIGYWHTKAWTAADAITQWDIARAAITDPKILPYRSETRKVYPTA